MTTETLYEVHTPAGTRARFAATGDRVVRFAPDLDRWMSQDRHLGTALRRILESGFRVRVVGMELR